MVWRRVAIAAAAAVCSPAISRSEPVPPAAKRAADGPSPAPLPKRCAAESPADRPCTTLAGRYRIELAPHDGRSCVVTKAVFAIVDVRGEGRAPDFDAKPLLEALALKPGKGDGPELGAAIRDGVCCLDLRLYGRLGRHHQRVLVHMAAGASRVSAKARDRWLEDEGSGMCGDEELEVKVTRLPPK